MGEADAEGVIPLPGIFFYAEEPERVEKALEKSRAFLFCFFFFSFAEPSSNVARV